MGPPEDKSDPRGAKNDIIISFRSKLASSDITCGPTEIRAISSHIVHLGPAQMPRKPSDTIAFKLRIRESLRRKLEVAAERNNTSINAEIANRLARSFETEAVRSLDEIANSLTLVCKQFG